MNNVITSSVFTSVLSSHFTAHVYVCAMHINEGFQSITTDNRGSNLHRKA